ncbi:hypothetical protein [Nostoc favosum]|uniref:Uncharacterized protein n=1 Tax=Nostoc favosum CHAB5714 TaxID=2780399 RepID=A0ABS8I869_9NOSO|nr:hypothetical protein [Nostoc favosum]MCC5600227.1 hypothetical protein [Nostoc favosum CHAB5714]
MTHIMNRFTSILLAGLIASASALAISPKADANTPVSYLAELDSYGYQRNDDGNYERHSRHHRNGDYYRQNDLRNIRDNNDRYERDNNRRYNRRYERDNNRRYERDNNLRNIRDNNRRYERDNNLRNIRDNNRRYERDNNLRNIRDNNRRYERDRNWGRG